MLTKKVLLIIFTVITIVAVLIAGFLLRSRDSKQSNDPVPIFGPIELPKAPHWDAPTNNLYFVDVYKSLVHKYVPKTNTLKSATVGKEALAFVIPITNTTDKFIISYGATIALITWDGESSKISNLRQIAYIDNDVYRANEGKVSPSGSLFVGTHSPFLPDGGFVKNAAGLYAFYPNATIKKVLDNVTVSNGMQWSADAKSFYYIDSLAYTVESFSYDINTDQLSNRVVLYNFTSTNTPGVPDGMTIDNEGMIWVTAFNGHQVLRINPQTRQVLESIELDSLQITSAAFAGPQLNDFYITTGAYKLSDEQKNVYKHSGWIYRSSNFKLSGRNGVPTYVANAESFHAMKDKFSVTLNT